MNIVQITPGTGNFYCGSCIRDSSLVAAMRRRGHHAVMLPLYLPVMAEHPTPADDSPIFFGGINVYLQEKAPLFRRTPRWLDRLFDAPLLLKTSARFAHMTRPADLGRLTVSMLRGEEGNQRKEVDRLVEWLKRHEKPDVVCLSNALLVGMARKVRAELNVPVVCTLQGEDYFLDGLPDPERGAAWETLATRAREIERFIAVSRYYGDVMRNRLGLHHERVEVVHNGIDPGAHEHDAAPSPHRAVGYLGRLCREKGLHTLVESFILLKNNPGYGDLKLRVAGTMMSADRVFVDEMRTRVEDAGLAAEVEISPNIPPENKHVFLRSLSVFSVPATYGEAFGLYVLEAMAAGVPVVQPHHGAFPEILEATGGGVLCEPDSAGSLAEKIGALLDRPDEARAMGLRGRDAVRASFTVDVMADRVLGILGKVVGGVEHERM